MSRTIRFHLDENCSSGIALGLRRRDVDVTIMAEAGLLGANDSDQLSFALAEGRVIVTQDEDLLALHAAGVPHAGIACCRKDSLRTGEMIRGLVLIWEVFEPGEMTNRVEYL